MPDSSKARLRLITAGVVLVVATLAAYWPAISDGGFVWDDDQHVTQNVLLRDGEGLRRIWTDPLSMPQFYPLVHTSFWLEYQLWELWAPGYHLTNVLLHALGALLLLYLLTRLEVPGAVVIAIAFALHPVHAESVAWVSERKNVLSGVLYFAAMSAWFRWAPPDDRHAHGTDAGTGESRTGPNRFYVLALVLFVAALLSKTVTWSLPAALLLLHWWKAGRLPRRLVLMALPLLVLGILGGSLTAYLERTHVGAASEDYGLAPVQRLMLAGRVPWFYAAKLIWPAQLTFNYPRWEIDPSDAWQVIAPVITVGLLLALVLLRNRIGRGPATGALFFVGSLSPALGFIDVFPFRYSWVADHFQYLASLGVFALVVGGSLACARRMGVSESRAVALLTATAVLVLAPLTHRQCRIYSSPQALWTDTIDKNPDAWMAHANLGKLYQEQGRYKPARLHLREAIQRNRPHPEPYCTLGVLLAERGDLAGAKLQFRRALERQHDHYGSMANLANVLMLQGDLDESVELYERCLVARPKRPEPHLSVALPLVKLGRHEEAREHLVMFLDHAPGHPRAISLLQSLDASPKSGTLLEDPAGGPHNSENLPPAPHATPVGDSFQ